MKNLTVFFGFIISFVLLSCESGRRVPRPSPPPSQTPLPQTPEVATYNCQYIGGHQIVGDHSCSKRFCYTWSWCQGHGSAHLFCEAILNAEGNYSCPSASACASSTAPYPGLIPYAWRNNCDGGGGDTYYESDDEEEDDEEEDKPTNIPDDRGP